MFDDSSHDRPLLLGVFVAGAIVGATLAALIMELLR
jgi:hypothetical protein